MSKVSVIIPNYNHEKFLKERIESVINQTYKNLEIVLLDDNSSDNSLEILLSYRGHPKVEKIIVNEINGGSPFKQWLKGINESSGEYIWIAESDDFADPHLVESLVEVFSKNKNVGVAFVNSQFIDERGDSYSPRWEDPYNNTLYKNDFILPGIDFINPYMVKRNAIKNASAAIFRRTTFEKTEIAFNDMKFAGDKLIWIKLLEISDVAYLSKKYNYLRFHDQITRTKKPFKLEKIRLEENIAINEYLKEKDLLTKSDYKETLQLYTNRWWELYRGRRTKLSFWNVPLSGGKVELFKKLVYKAYKKCVDL